MKKNSAIILLSGGLDSYVSLDMAQKKYDIKMALTFDYGQKPFREIFGGRKNARHYNIKHKKITLPFEEIKGYIWVPNRNGYFKYSGCFCDAFNYDAIISVQIRRSAKIR
jgi:7-cyano-7-deazaguanine synthase